MWKCDDPRKIDVDTPHPDGINDCNALPRPTWTESMIATLSHDRPITAAPTLNLGGGGGRLSADVLACAQQLSA